MSSEVNGPEHESSTLQVESALATLHERYLERRGRELRVQMGEAQRRGDQAMLLQLTQQRMALSKERAG